jgi:hypothetical protein
MANDTLRHYAVHRIALHGVRRDGSENRPAASRRSPGPPGVSGARHTGRGGAEAGDAGDAGDTEAGFTEAGLAAAGPDITTS